MNLEARLALLITAIGADVKALQSQITSLTSGASGPWTYVVLGSDVANSTVTPANVVSTGTTLAAGKYALEGKMWWTTVASTTEALFNMTFPAQVTLADAWRQSISVTSASGIVTIAQNTASADTAGSYLTLVDGIFTVTGTMASAISAQMKSTVASSAVTAKAGSYISYRKIA